MRTIVIGLAALVAAASWYLVDGRYSYLPAGKEGYTLRVDRLSGTVLKCGTAGCTYGWSMSVEEFSKGATR